MSYHNRTEIQAQRAKKHADKCAMLSLGNCTRENRCKWDSEKELCDMFIQKKSKAMNRHAPQSKNFTGVCVSKISWCFQAGNDKELCKPLVKTGQCAFLEIGGYSGCVANEASFRDPCYKKAEDSEEKCGAMPAGRCAFVKTHETMSVADSQEDAALADSQVASGSFTLQVSAYVAALVSVLIQC